jgi:hypothetical protein
MAEPARRRRGTYRPAAQGGALELRANGELELAELQEQLKSEIIAPQAAKLAQTVHDLAGKAKFDLTLQQQPKAPMQVAGKLTLDGARLRVEKYFLTDLKGDLTFTPQEIRAEKARALLSGSPVQGVVTVRNYAADNGVFDVRVEPTIKPVITTCF